MCICQGVFVFLSTLALSLPLLFCLPLLRHGWMMVVGLLDVAATAANVFSLLRPGFLLWALLDAFLLRACIQEALKYGICFQLREQQKVFNIRNLVFYAVLAATTFSLVTTTSDSVRLAFHTTRGAGMAPEQQRVGVLWTFAVFHGAFELPIQILTAFLIACNITISSTDPGSSFLQVLRGPILLHGIPAFCTQVSRHVAQSVAIKLMWGRQVEVIPQEALRAVAATTALCHFVSTIVMMGSLLIAVIACRRAYLGAVAVNRCAPYGVEQPPRFLFSIKDFLQKDSEGQGQLRTNTIYDQSCTGLHDEMKIQVSSCACSYLFTEGEATAHLLAKEVEDQASAPRKAANTKFAKFKCKAESLHTYSPANLTEDEEATIRDVLTEHFGPSFYSQYQHLGQQVPMDDDTRLVQNVVKLMKQQFHKLRQVFNVEVKPHWSHFLAVAALEKDMKVRSGNVPCRDAASCKKLEHLVNRCNYIRKGAMVASNLFNAVTHVLNGVMSVLCGCLFVGPVHLCVLKNFPYTCKLPFPVYGSLYMGTAQVWEVVKATSNMCRMYGDPGLGSILAVTRRAAEMCCGEAPVGGTAGGRSRDAGSVGKMKGGEMSPSLRKCFDCAV
ncbi:uncharacterized protein LOC34622564 [Cyclospora cayetanensis]|uniref:Uncharacterized protein LOC34622564 n=1 Tax=Cyclospora cayetanensis TaxID=88456 RepID=A0A6P6RWN1_9EIME|nr:uncharacterized protein LOC34622564 [Cyclospora cayetanensis]